MSSPGFNVNVLVDEFDGLGSETMSEYATVAADRPPLDLLFQRFTQRST